MNFVEGLLRLNIPERDLVFIFLTYSLRPEMRKRRNRKWRVMDGPLSGTSVAGSQLAEAGRKKNGSSTTRVLYWAGGY